MKCTECKNYKVEQYKNMESVIKICAANKEDLRIIVNLNKEYCKDYISK